MKEEDKKDAWTDEFGVKYSKDGKKLLESTNRYLKNYTIKKGTRSIGDCAFASQPFNNTHLHKINYVQI
jgi:hypothetical protein